ncbi:hypothetical protein BY996DRAFT_4580851 [Phakopsora pachyrhizi]|uniref:C2H2-type domain-containing protein n=1 Tax=Phakopsora pachyrhizi TaxID=170000 RepID=A0AAV0AZL8_PHAPC|nr:hypothetical protein BY996DRAFT_4580851 [Phakopsora pachyrhizi]CAH7676096.1 hypothetical protein PPACK8108_LOCUS11194 [Phakopsora pachyrhizi]
MFARAFNMETHRNTHSGYRPHQCSNCLKFFSRRHDLHRHMVAVHQDHSKVPLSNRSSLNKSTEITKRE